MDESVNIILEVLMWYSWIATYVLSILAILLYKMSKMTIPYIAIITNVCWELNSLLFYNGNALYVIWFVLDCIVFLVHASIIKTNRGRILFLSGLLICSVIFSFCFEIPGFMLFSSFGTNVVMSLCFIIQIENISPKFRVSIAVTKMIGTFTASLYFAKHSFSIIVLGIIILIIDLGYLYLCIWEKKYAKSVLDIEKSKDMQFIQNENQVNRDILKM